jgi:tetratricopeptide (TPR) repeat protein
MSARSDRVKVIEQAEKYVRAGRVKEAIAEYEKLALTDPQDVGTLNIIGDLYIRLGHADRAVRSFVKVAEEYERRGLFSQALAIYKKIHKLEPGNADYALKLGDLYGQQGFLADARIAYLAVAKRLVEGRRLTEAIAIYEKTIRLDPSDVETRLALAVLYRENGYAEPALDQFNAVADVHSERGRFDEAVEVLRQALAFRPDDVKSLVNLVEVHKKANRADKAVEVLEKELASNPDNVQLLNILGNIYFEAGDVQKAEDVFTRIVTGHPLNVNARIKLGRLQILKDKLDQAYELFEPLINNLVKKHRDEKAIGLLGLILESQKPHMPTLERLAQIYRSNKEVKKLEVVDRAILDELRKQDAKDRMLNVYAELLELRPEDVDLAREARALRHQLGLAEEPVPEESSGLSDKDREAIQETMAQADLYMQQGLVRIARRLLENLRFRYPEEPQILRKIAVLDEVRTHMDEEEIRKRVERTSVLEAQFKEKAAGKRAEERRTEGRKLEEKRAEDAKPGDAKAEDKKAAEKKPTAGPFRPEVLEGEKVSTADIFAETDIIPFLSPETGERKYYDLKAAAAEELRMLAAARDKQLRGDTFRLERELSGIVAEFRRDLRAKVSLDDAETHYQLGLAFLEQGLTGEAVEELSQAARDPKLALDGFSAIGQAYLQKRDFEEAEKWLRKALAAAREGSEQYYALVYELAGVVEGAEDRDKAVSLLREVRAWNPGYRDVSARLEGLEKAAAD